MEWSPSTSFQLNMATGALVPEEITPKLSKIVDCTSPKNEWHGPVPYIPSVLELRSNGMSYQPQQFHTTSQVSRRKITFPGLLFPALPAIIVFLRSVNNILFPALIGKPKKTNFILLFQLRPLSKRLGSTLEIGPLLTLLESPSKICPYVPKPSMAKIFFTE